MEKLKSWFKKLFNQRVEDSQESGITCSYEGGYYTFLYAILELINKGKGYIMYKKGSETFVILSGGTFELYDFKSFNENWKFRWHSGTVSKRFMPNESDLKEVWVVEKKTPLNQYDSGKLSAVGFVHCGDTTNSDNIKMAWWNNFYSRYNIKVR